MIIIRPLFILLLSLYLHKRRERARRFHYAWIPHINRLRNFFVGTDCDISL